MDGYLMDEMFEEMMQALGYTDWWQTEFEWEGAATLLIQFGFSREMVDDFFEEMAWDLQDLRELKTLFFLFSSPRARAAGFVRAAFLGHRADPGNLSIENVYKNPA